VKVEGVLVYLILIIEWLVMEQKDDQLKNDAKHTAAGIPTWSPTVVLICRSTAYVWQSGRDAQFSADCGRMCSILRSYGQ
jgi:hypothetical protein